MLLQREISSSHKVILTQIGDYKLMDVVICLIVLFELGVCAGIWMTDRRRSLGRVRSQRVPISQLEVPIDVTGYWRVRASVALAQGSLWLVRQAIGSIRIRVG